MLVFFATIAAAYGAQEMTAENEANDLGRYRMARLLMRQGRRTLVALAADGAVRVETPVLIG